MQNLFRPEQVAFVYLVDPDDDRRYPSRIILVAEGDELWIGAPVRRGEDELDDQEIVLEPDTPLILEVLLSDGIRRFPSVVRRRIDGTPATLVVDWPKDVERIQRRNDVRVEVSLRIEMEPLVETEGLPPVIEGSTIDLSAGGLRVLTSELLPADEEVRLRMQLPEQKQVNARGQVLRCQPTGQSGHQPHYWAAIRFTVIDERDRRDLTKLVFDIQREMLRRGTV